MNLEDVKPIKRSKLRITCGKVYFTMKRRLIWMKNKEKYTRVSYQILYFG